MDELEENICECGREMTWDDDTWVGGWYCPDCDAHRDYKDYDDDQNDDPFMGWDDGV